jgi:unsaturated rhamnogalacturonyl hydrolase
MLRGKYRSHTIQSWQDAGLLAGLSEKESVEYAARRFNPASGEWKQKPRHIDAALLAYVLKKNGALPPEAEKTMLELLLSLKKDGKTIPYRPDVPHLRFVDTIGLAAPFLAACGRWDIAAAQVEEYDRALLHGSSAPAHAYNLECGVPLGIHDWSRGTGWYILGLAESNAGGRFDDRIVALAEDMLRWQRADGGFGAMFFNEGSR